MKKVIISLLVILILFGSVAVAEETHIPWERDGAVMREPCLTLDPWQPSFLSVEQLDLIWPGQGQALHDLEIVWSINAIFAASVAQIESGKQNKWNNFFGIKGTVNQPRNSYGFRTWESAYDGILGFGRYIRTSGYYPVGCSIEYIGSIYCGPYWAAPVYSEMRHLISIVEENLK